MKPVNSEQCLDVHCTRISIVNITIETKLKLSIYLHLCDHIKDLSTQYSFSTHNLDKVII